MDTTARMPSACAPSRSACSDMIDLSQVATVAMVSTPDRSCRASAMLSESMCVRAFSRGCTNTSPRPRSASSAAVCSASPARPVAGGVTEAATTNRPAASWSASDPAPRAAAGGPAAPSGRRAAHRRRPRPAATAPGAARPRPGGQRVDRGPDVRRRGAAAAADQGHPGLGEPGQVAGEVTAVDGELERARPGPARLPGVGLGADRDGGVPDQVLGHDQHPLRADGAVGADHRDRQARTAPPRPPAGSRRPGCARRRQRWPGRSAAGG